MTVRAKFQVYSETRSPSSKYDAATGTYIPTVCRSFKLTVVSSGSEENKAFFASTPTGILELNILNDAAADQFVLGKEYYVDFTPAS